MRLITGVKNPTEKVRSKYSVLYSEGSPRYARDDAENQLSLRRSVATAAIPQTKYVILNDSEESHRRTDKYIVRT